MIHDDEMVGNWVERVPVPPDRPRRLVGGCAHFFEEYPIAEGLDGVDFRRRGRDPDAQMAAAKLAESADILVSWQAKKLLGRHRTVPGCSVVSVASRA